MQEMISFCVYSVCIQYNTIRLIQNDVYSHQIFSDLSSQAVKRDQRYRIFLKQFVHLKVCQKCNKQCKSFQSFTINDLRAYSKSFFRMNSHSDIQDLIWSQFGELPYWFCQKQPCNQMQVVDLGVMYQMCLFTKITKS